MKNLRKALAVVIALTMVMSTVAFAAVFSDVADDASYAEAIELGAAINLFTGYEDGTFKPEGDITRAEFAAIIVRMLGQEAQADGATGTTDFADVPSTHWAAGYINIVSNLGIVNGYGDGNFGPEDNVT
ncbi:MAG: S-layer homology domain-containing protein [Clostridiaceae bacterium]|nr:S-layer homology domain-containing protein [Clostridiaceae bacterium]